VQQSENVYFTGILVSAGTDRLGSVTHNGAGDRRYYPYGVGYTTSTDDTEKYATYTRASLTGLDYAVNRYYSSQWGRFLSPDPARGSVFPPDPGTWNRYPYVKNDPVNESDPSGLGENGDAPDPPGYWGSDNQTPTGPTGCLEVVGFRMTVSFTACAGTGGGGSGRNPWAAVAQTTAAMQAALASELPSLANSNCMAFLAKLGYTMDDLKFLATTITYFDVTGPAGDLTLGQALSEAQSRFFFSRSLLLLLSCGWSKVMWRCLFQIFGWRFHLTRHGPKCFFSETSRTPWLLWHEFWHAGLGISEEDAAENYDITMSSKETATEAFESMG